MDMRLGDRGLLDDMAMARVLRGRARVDGLNLLSPHLLLGGLDFFWFRDFLHRVGWVRVVRLTEPARLLMEEEVGRYRYYGIC